MLTRYLYDRTNAEHSLFIAILNRDPDEAKFWTYELYHSGLYAETMTLLWRIYYQLYAGFFVNLERFLLRMTNEPDWTVAVGSIVDNLVNREPCIEFYRIMTGTMDGPPHMIEWIERIKVAQNDDECYKTTESFINKHGCFRGKGTNIYQRTRDALLKIPGLSLEIVKYACISRMFTGMFLLDPDNGLDGRMHIVLGEEDVAKYKNKPFIKNRGKRLLKRECLYSLVLNPDYKKEDVYDYNDDSWLFRASLTPIWEKRIEKYGGSRCDTSVVFDDDDQADTFHSLFNFEPDEQSIEIKTKLRGKYIHTSWREIYAKYACAPFNEWMSTYT